MRCTHLVDPTDQSRRTTRAAIEEANAGEGEALGAVVDADDVDAERHCEIVRSACARRVLSLSMV